MLPRTVTHRYTGEQVTFVHTAEETNGEFLQIEVALPPHGDGPPLHRHLKFTEEFTCIAGELLIRHNGQKITLSPGQHAKIQLRESHTFTNDTDQPVRFMVRLSPPSNFEESMRIHYGLMDDGLTDKTGKPNDIAHLALILLLQDTLVAGAPIKFQQWLLTRLVRKGFKRGAYKNLEKYIGKPLTF